MSRNHPSASVTAKSGAVGGLVQGTDSIAVVGCSSGSLATMTPVTFQGTVATIASAGYGDPVEFMCGYFKRSKSVRNPNGLPCTFVKTPVTTAGVVRNFNTGGVTGASVVTQSGTPLFRVDLFVFKVVNGGTVGTDGITFVYSFGGRDFSGVQRLGTATTWAIPNLGVTLSLTSASLNAGDIVTLEARGPRASNADISTALAALFNLSSKFRCVLITGDYAEADVSTLLSDISTWYMGNKRSIFFVSNRDSRQLANLDGTYSISFASSGHTITRAAGSWITDGFTTDGDVIVSGSSLNNGNLGKPTTVTATVLTFTAGITTEGPLTSGLTITGLESETEWATALLADAASFQDTDGRVAWGVGQAWVESQVERGMRMRYPAVWSVVERYMQHDIQISPNAKANGPLDDWQITDDTNNIVEHDSRTLSTLEARGFLTLCSFVGESGAFVGFPATFGPDGSALGIIPWRAVANAMEDIVQKSTEQFIGDDPELNSDGTLASEEVERYTNLVNQQLTSELLSSKTEGPRASQASWTPSTTDVLDVPGATMNGEGLLETNGLINQVITNVTVNANGG